MKKSEGCILIRFYNAPSPIPSKFLLIQKMLSLSDHRNFVTLFARC